MRQLVAGHIPSCHSVPGPAQPLWDMGGEEPVFDLAQACSPYGGLFLLYACSICSSVIFQTSPVPCIEQQSVFSTFSCSFLKNSPAAAPISTHGEARNHIHVALEAPALILVTPPARRHRSRKEIRVSCSRSLFLNLFPASQGQREAIFPL